MRTLYCSICSSSFDPEAEGVEGDIGIIPVAFCAVCQTGIREFAMNTWDLSPTGMHPTICPECMEITCDPECPNAAKRA